MKVVRKNTAKGHYYLDADTGERVPGVTTIVGDEDRLTAIVMLIESSARKHAAAALKGLADA